MKNKTELNPIDVQIGKTLKMIRLDRKLTRAQLGAALSEPISQQAIERYENGANRIAASTLVELTRILKCKVADLLAGVENTIKAFEDITLADRKSINLLQHYQAVDIPEIQEAIRNLTSAIALGLAKHFTRSKPHE